jgi:hypothetical protein
VTWDFEEAKDYRIKVDSPSQVTTKQIVRPKANFKSKPPKDIPAWNKATANDICKLSFNGLVLHRIIDYLNNI